MSFSVKQKIESKIWPQPPNGRIKSVLGKRGTCGNSQKMRTWVISAMKPYRCRHPRRKKSYTVIFSNQNGLQWCQGGTSGCLCQTQQDRSRRMRTVNEESGVLLKFRVFQCLSVLTWLVTDWGQGGCVVTGTEEAGHRKHAREFEKRI